MTLKQLISLTILCLAAYLVITLQLPKENDAAINDSTQFSTLRAKKHVEAIAKETHPTTTQANKEVAEYLIESLQKLGLDPQTQEGNSYSDWGNFTKVRNIITKIQGRKPGKSLVVMTHYDSAPHSSYGASDAGSGVATILEGIRAFLSKNPKPKNDIIVVFTDGEELGLSGASLFVNQHPWAKNIGLILNFEARGSGGPSYTLLETNHGNKNLIQEFIKANPQYPVANSLAYSIYKKMPNDTDLTVFRKQNDNSGFNFAFIDDHFDYHTALDVPDRLDNNSLAHQGSYLMPLLDYFSESDLNIPSTKEDLVYFNTPIGLHSYSYKLIIPLVAIGLIGLMFILVKQRNKFNKKYVRKGFLSFSIVLLLNALIGFGGWKLIILFYPNYQEILQGFPYNGHWYIGFFILASLAISLLIYSFFKIINHTKELYIAPIFFWLLINIGIATGLKGASFLIIPTLFALITLYYISTKHKPNIWLITLLCLPTVIILTPFVEQFPIALGMKLVVSTTMLVGLILGLLLPAFGYLKHKKRVAFLLFIGALVCFTTAHLKSDFSPERPKPNSLVFLSNNDTQKSYWLSYDHVLDSWNTPYFKELDSTLIDLGFSSKYSTSFAQVAKANFVQLPNAKTHIYQDSIINNERNIRFSIVPQSNINSIQFNSDSKNNLIEFNINQTPINLKNNSGKFTTKASKKIVLAYLTKKDTLHIKLVGKPNSDIHLELLEITNNLTQNPFVTVPKRLKNQTPKPFVINDAVINQHNITF